MLLTELGLLRCLDPDPGRAPACAAESVCATAMPPLSTRPSSVVLSGCCMRQLFVETLLAMLSTVLAAETGRSAGRPSAELNAVRCCAAIVRRSEEAEACFLAVFARTAASAAAKSSPSLALQALCSGKIRQVNGIASSLRSAQL